LGILKPRCVAAVLRVLAEDKLEQFADQVQTRIFEGREEAGVGPDRAQKQQQKYNTFIQRNAGPFQAFLTKSGGTFCACLTLTPAIYVVLYVALFCRPGC